MRTAGLVMALMAVACAIRCFALWGPEPFGTDGYYYIVQLEDLVATGSLHVPDASWTLRALALPHALGLPAISALVLASSLLAALVVPAAAALHPSRALPLAAMAASSPTLTHLAGDFPKSLGLAAPLLLAIVALDRGRADRRWLFAAVPALILAATAHRLGAVFSALVLAGWGVSLAGPAARRALLALVAALSAFAWISYFVPGLLHPAELDRVTSQLRASPWPPMPWSWLPLRPDTSVAQHLELTMPWVALLLAPLAWRRAPAVVAMLLAALLPVWFPLYATDTLDLGYRVSLFGPLFAAPIVALALPDRVPGWLGLLFLPMALVGPTPSTTPPYAMYRQVLHGIPEPLPELLIAHQGMNFLYDHMTGAEAMAWAPEAHLDPQRVGRVTYGVRSGDWMAVFPEGAPDVVSLGSGYHYVREDVWNALTADPDVELQARIDDWRNPQQVRPAAMLRGR